MSIAARTYQQAGRLKDLSHTQERDFAREKIREHRSEMHQ